MEKNTAVMRKYISSEYYFGKIAPNDICPFRTDILYLAMSKFTRGNPVYNGILYLITSYTLILVHAFIYKISGHAEILTQILSQKADNINLAIIAPVGAGLLSHLYSSIYSTFKYLEDDEMIKTYNKKEFTKLITSLNRLYNTKIVIILFILVSLGINIFTYYTRTDTIFSVSGGAIGIHGRIIIFINFWMLGLIMYKCFVTILGLWKLFKFELDIQPMHPDRSAGLKPIGELSLSINYFFALVVVYSAISHVFIKFSQGVGFRYGLFLISYLTAPLLFFATLAKISNKMKEKKQEVLNKLVNTFRNSNVNLIGKLDTEEIDIKLADEIEKISILYKTVDEMPVWPFDSRTIKKFFTTYTFPILLIFIPYVITEIQKILN